ncbi:hypothetical protein RUND412_003658 [Rhizina undulata]
MFKPLQTFLTGTTKSSPLSPRVPISKALLSSSVKPSIPFVLKATMSTTELPQKKEWICIIPDQEGALERRLKVRPDHLKGVKRLAAEGFFTFGGVMFDDVPQEGQTPSFKGSIMLALGNTKEEVVEVLKKDIYTTSNVWDWDKFRTAIRAPLPYN